jgi:lipopolysaccharide export system protein LptA
MKRLQKKFVIVSLMAAVATLSASAAGEKGGGLSAEAVTVITSEKLTFDYKKQYALFETNVLVTDPEMQLAADRLTVLFDDKRKAQSIKAEGRVTIRQADKTAQAGPATYDFKTGKIVLAIKPRVTRDRDMIEGEIITFWRDQNRMICQPQARLVIYPEKGGVKDQFFGE